MQLNRFSDYALRVLMYLAQHGGEPVTIAQVARAHSISENHLMKVVNRLATLKYLTTMRGRGGGITLGRPAADISVGAVVRDLEPMALAECMASHGGECSLAPRCTLTRILDLALTDFLERLDRYSVADLNGSARQLRRGLAST